MPTDETVAEIDDQALAEHLALAMVKFRSQLSAQYATVRNEFVHLSFEGCEVVANKRFFEEQIEAVRSGETLLSFDTTRIR